VHTYDEEPTPSVDSSVREGDCECEKSPNESGDLTKGIEERDPLGEFLGPEKEREIIDDAWV
jgi:hypothetical protein